MDREERIAVERVMVAKFAADVAAWLKRIGKDHVWLAEQLHLNPAVTSAWARGRRFPCARDLATVLSLCGGEIKTHGRTRRAPRTSVTQKKPKKPSKS